MAATLYTSLSVGTTGQATINRISSATASVDFGAIGTLATSSLTVSLPGAAAGDLILATPGSNWSGDYLNLRVTPICLAAGVVTVYASNQSAGSINADASTFRFASVAF